ncbi:hypothetical protein KAR91_11130 [Candidatus Pacearchaeota archaeon]|nr:hypothetical protein [Candidatus Pacearchaeota archaeon]
MANNEYDLTCKKTTEYQAGSAATVAGDKLIIIDVSDSSNPVTRTVQDILDLVEAGDFDNPMTGIGDIIVGLTAGAPARLGKGTTGQGLVMAAGTPAWATINPMTTLGDVVVGTTAGAVSRLGIADASYVLGGGATPAWRLGAITAQVSVSLAELNAGKVIIPAVTGKQIVVLDFNIVCDGSFAALTSAELEDSSASVNVCSLAQAQMTDDAVLTKGITGVTLGVGIAEGLTVSESLDITLTGATATTATGLIVVVTYMLV